MTERALLVIDMQNDFMPGGVLPVPEGDKIIPIINEYVELFNDNGYLIIATRDWHPAETKHFKKFGGEWPPHCVQKTRGAEFHEGLNFPAGTVVISKGDNPESEGYSCFEGHDSFGKPMRYLLKENDIEELYVCGAATDYCVKNSVLDALKNDFRIFLLTDAVKGINAEEGDSEKAIQEMTEKGAAAVDMKKVKLEIEAPAYE